jgi:hypothetical protein
MFGSCLVVLASYLDNMHISVYAYHLFLLGAALMKFPSTVGTFWCKLIPA